MTLEGECEAVGECHPCMYVVSGFSQLKVLLVCKGLYIERCTYNFGYYSVLRKDWQLYAKLHRFNHFHGRVTSQRCKIELFTFAF